MRNYLIDLRYTQELEYVAEETRYGKTQVILKGSDGDTYRWDTCKKSAPYKYIKEHLKGEFEFTYRGELLEHHLVSHLRTIKR